MVGVVAQRQVAGRVGPRRVTRAAYPDDAALGQLGECGERQKPIGEDTRVHQQQRPTGPAVVGVFDRGITEGETLNFAVRSHGPQASIEIRLATVALHLLSIVGVQMPKVKPSRRPYSSPVREEQVRTTRKRILAAAHASFIKRGYSGTRISDVADSAGVSPETIYATFGGKRGLLEGVIELAITGPDEVPLEQQEQVTRIVALPTPAERLRAFVREVCGVLARTSPVHVVIRGAADREEFAVTLQQGLLRTRVTKTRQFLQSIVGNALRPGLSIDEATQRFCAISSPEMHHLLIGQLGWTLEDHEEWFAELVERDLLGADTKTRQPKRTVQPRR